jgi:hypothetical protein
VRRCFAYSHGSGQVFRRLYLEADVDDGLFGWSSITDAASRASLVNRLSGEDVFPGYERYIRSAAEYRTAHPSPWAVPGAIEKLGTDVQEQWHPLQDRDKAIAEVVRRYAR